MSNDNIIIKVSVKAKDEIRDKKILVKMFTNHYMNIVEKPSGSAPNSIGNLLNPNHDKCKGQNIIQCYKNHPSKIEIKTVV